MAQSVNWCFTLNNPAADDVPRAWDGVRYCVWQKEQGENGTPHLQGYLVLTQKKTLSYVKLLCPAAHWEIRRGTHKQAKAYCTKEESRKDGPWEFGDEPVQGKRTDLIEICEKVKAGTSTATIAEEHSDTFVRYHRGILCLQFTLSRPRNFKTEVTVIYGATGVGKSKWAFDKFGEEAYWKLPNNKWWDGYTGQDVCIIDEFYGWLSWTEILRLCDRYPCGVESKGGVLQFRSKKLIFLSNDHPIRWYSNPRCQYPTLARRIENLGEMIDGGAIVTELGNFE